MNQTSAPGKLILGGEHAVVYGQPAIAIPLQDLRATVSAQAAPAGSGLTVTAPALGVVWRLQAAEPLSDLARRTLEQLGCAEPDLALTIESALPIASGMGSGAAVGAALVRALAAAAAVELTRAQISALVYESERAFHGTPSGIDNTVVAYERPIWFQRRLEDGPLIEPLAVGGPWTFVIGDSGVPSATKAVVADLRQRRDHDPLPYAERFATIGMLVGELRHLLAGRDGPTLGSALTRNQSLLYSLNISSPELDTLITAALDAGAWGAKLSGAGWGGVMLALTSPSRVAGVAEALRAAGAVRTWTTRLEAL